jgi:hypothetical protein
MSKIIYNSSESHFEIRCSRYEINISSAVIKVSYMGMFYYYRYSNKEGFERVMLSIWGLLAENKTLLDMLFDFEKAESFEFIYVNSSQPTTVDLGSVLNGTFGANQYFETLNLAQINFSKAKVFVAQILDFYSDNYE